MSLTVNFHSTIINLISILTLIYLKSNLSLSTQSCKILVSKVRRSPKLWRPFDLDPNEKKHVYSNFSIENIMVQKRVQISSQAESSFGMDLLTCGICSKVFSRLSFEISNQKSLKCQKSVLILGIVLILFCLKI